MSRGSRVLWLCAGTLLVAFVAQVLAQTAEDKVSDWHKAQTTPTTNTGLDRDKVWDRLKRNGVLTYSMEGSLDGARRVAVEGEPDCRTQLWTDRQGLRKVLIVHAVTGDADMLTSLRFRQYDTNWRVVKEYPVSRYAFLKPSKDGGDVQLAAKEGSILNDYMGNYIRYMDLSNSGNPVADETRYQAARQSYFDWIKAHLKHRYATGLIGPFLHPKEMKLSLDDVFDSSLQNVRSHDFVKPKKDPGIKCTNWTLEFAFQKKSSWPAVDKEIITKAGSICTPRRYNGQADYWGFWLSPAVFASDNPPEVADACKAATPFSDSDWDGLRTATNSLGEKLYDVVTLRKDQTLDLTVADHYSTVWGPQDNDYYFDPGHGRQDLASLPNAHSGNTPWYQYQMQVLVKSKGDIEDGGTTYSVGPYYFSDLFYVEMYATLKTVPPTLAEARKLFGQTCAYYTPATSGDERTVTPVDQSFPLFPGASGTPDGLACPDTTYPKDAINLKTSLPATFAEDASVYYKTGADTQSLIRFPKKGSAVPETLPASAKSPEGFQNFLDQYYNQYAVYYPPVTVEENKIKVTKGPWIVNLTEAPHGLPAGNRPHPYAPSMPVPGTDGKVCWKDVVYKPTRFSGGLEDAVDFLYSKSTGDTAAAYGTSAMPGGYKYALKGEIWGGHPVFTVNTNYTQNFMKDSSAKLVNYTLCKAAFPIPVGYQTMHGDVADTKGTVLGKVTAGADVMLADVGIPPTGTDSIAEAVVPPIRDNYLFSAVTISAGCCGTVTQKVIDKKVGTAFQPRAGLSVTITDLQATVSANGGVSIETIGTAIDTAAGTGKSPLPYDPMSVSSRLPDNYAYGNFQNNFASLTYSQNPQDAPNLMTDAKGKNILESQLTYYAGQAYDLKLAAEPATGPTMVRLADDSDQVYYCVRQFRAEIWQISPANTKIKDINLIGPSITEGPYAGLNTEPPMGSVNIVWPQEGNYEVRVFFEDCNGQKRDMISHVKVIKKGFEPNLVGEERERK